MPRVKSARNSIVKEPSRVQDNTGFGNRLANTFIDEFVNPLVERVENLETIVGQLALARGVVHTADVELSPLSTGGTVVVEPEGGYEPDAVGRPVLVNQGPNGDSDEGGIVLFTGDVLSVQQMRLHYFSPFGAPGRVQVVYLIG